MTAQEFSAEFDLLYNNVSSNQAPGLTEYEKSVFLTKAQDEIIKNYFTNVQGGNKYQQGIEDSSKRFSDFAALLTVATLESNTGETPFDERGKMFKLPDGNKFPKAMITITETFRTGKSESDYTAYNVVPLKFDEYVRLMSKPSTDPLKKQVWKLMGNSSSGNGSFEIVPHWKDKDNSYNRLILKYIRKPYPIILEKKLSEGLTIEGYDKSYDVYMGEAEDDNSYQVLALGNTGKFAILKNYTEVLPEVYDAIQAANGAIANMQSTPKPVTNQACELSEEIHPEILQRAVELAKVFYNGDNQQVLTAGARTE